ncbi:MAG: hypothetical protein Q4C47_00120 [Planctomycetia bacterium]|nr:hypothetical protein [Planctomycetia bacterium]
MRNPMARASDGDHGDAVFRWRHRPGEKEDRMVVPLPVFHGGCDGDGRVEWRMSAVWLCTFFCIPGTKR